MTEDRAHQKWRSLVSLALALAVLTPMSGAAAQEDADQLINPYFDDGASEGSGAGKRIGYISLGEAEEFVAIVTEGIREQAKIAGVDLIFCDSQFLADEALICARLMAAAGVDGILNFQLFEEDAGRICTAHGNLPTIAIDIHQQPCERSFVGVDNRRAGLLTGDAVGRFLQRERDCEYDTLFVLQSGPVGRVGLERTGGMVDGFAEVCGPVPESKLKEVDAGGAYGPTLEAMSAELLTVPVNGVHVVLSINEGAAYAAVDAAISLGRVAELRIGAQGVETVKREVACDDHWIAATAYFPERYGHVLIPAMIDLLDGREVAADLFLPHVAVTAENIAEVYDEVPDCSSD